MAGKSKTAYVLSISAAAFLCLSVLLPKVPERARDLVQQYENLRTFFLQEPTSSSSFQCVHDYTIEILSFDPVVIYINNFIKETEIDYILNLMKDEFHQSAVYNYNLETVIDRKYRTSTSAMVPYDDPVSVCLSDRMKAFLGNAQHIDTEGLQVVRYEGGERFRMHLDWFRETRNDPPIEGRAKRPYNRLGSIFAYLDDDCTGGETYFPDVRGVGPDADGDKFARTDSDSDMGLLVKPKRGNAVFWNNLLPNGTGDPRVAHAGLPVKSGVKIGMNLFSYYYLDAPLIGGSVLGARIE